MKEPAVELSPAHAERILQVLAWPGAKAVDGKTISVTGKIIKYRNSPEMELTTPDQLTIIKETPATSP